MLFVSGLTNCASAGTMAMLISSISATGAAASAPGTARRHHCTWLGAVAMTSSAARASATVGPSTRPAGVRSLRASADQLSRNARADSGSAVGSDGRSEEHTSELQSRLHLVCRLLLEKKNEQDPM